MRGRCGPCCGGAGVDAHGSVHIGSAGRLAVSRHIPIVEEALRDAHQCLWSTRMTNEMMLPVAERMDAVGYDAMDLIGGAVWDVSIRFLLEDPWERIRHMRKLVTKTPLNAWVRGQSLWTFEIFPDDVVELAMERLAANGIRRATIYDHINDMEGLQVVVNKAVQVGLEVSGALVFTLSPVHTDEHFAERAAEFVRMGATEVVIKDPSGLLSVERIRTMGPALKKAIGNAALNLHTHCMTGRAPDVLLESVDYEMDKVHCAISPLAHAASHSPTEWINEKLIEKGFSTGLDVELLDEIADYFHFVARRWDKPVGAPVAFDPRVLEHQMPGGMISNLASQLGTIGLEHRLDEVLDEMGQVRKELGYLPIVSPSAQFIATQSVLNLVQGERYKTIPDELQKYILGYYGRPPAPIDQDLVDRVAKKSSDVVTGPSGSHVPPVLDKIRKERGPFKSDDDLLLAAMYPHEIIQPLFEAREKADYTRFYRAHTPVEQLLKEVKSRPDLRRFEVSKGDDFNVAYAN
ncbi:MAG: carboxylase [Thiotrichales bacterium]|nr:carboxylase [Thiotrichales bacterium]